MNTITCPHCGTAVAEDDSITGTCPACDNTISAKRKYKESEADVERFLETMDRLDRGEFR